MFVLCVNVYVKPEFVAAFIEASRGNVEGTAEEPGNLQFELSQAKDDRSRFFIYEVYQSEEAFKAHQQTAHYAAWRDAVNEMMAAPRQGVKYETVFER